MQRMYIRLTKKQNMRLVMIKHILMLTVIAACIVIIALTALERVRDKNKGFIEIVIDDDDIDEDIPE